MYPIFLDTETTDKNPDSRLVQLAYKDSSTGEVVDEIYLPPVPVSYGSMAIHHITQEMVDNKPAFKDTETKNKIQELLKENYLVAHNAPFDINILKNEGVKTFYFIDTLRVAQHLISDAEEYNLQYLRYFLGLKFKEQITPHDALGDILVLEGLFYYLENLVKEKFGLTNQEDILKQMAELSTTPLLLKQLTFGKYKGILLDELIQNDRGYLEWLFNSENSKPELEQNENLIFTLKSYLN